MSYNFIMECVKPIDDTYFEKISDRNIDYSLAPYHIIHDLVNSVETQIVDGKSLPKLYLDWFHKCYTGYDKSLGEKSRKPTLANCFDPILVRDSLDEFLQRIWEMESNLPICYMISKNKETMSHSPGDYIFYNGKPYHIDSDNDKLIATPVRHLPGWESNTSPIIDLSDKIKFECNDSLSITDEKGNFTYQEGPKITLVISKDSFESNSSSCIEDMFKVSTIAVEDNFLIYTHTG